MVHCYFNVEINHRESSQSTADSCFNVDINHQESSQTIADFLLERRNNTTAQHFAARGGRGARVPGALLRRPVGAEGLRGGTKI